MADVTIGRVSVKVYPDTSDFRKHLKADLEKIEKGLKIEVDALLNSKMLARHADAVVERMNSKAERSKRRIIFDADLDTNNIGERARVAAAEVDKAMKDSTLDLSTALDDEALRKVRDTLDDLVDDYDGKNIELQAGVDSLVARAELARVSRDRLVALHIQVSKASLAKAEATLAALSGLRLLGSTLDNLSDMFKNLDKNIPIIGTIAEAVIGLSAWLLAAASNTFTLARGLAQIGGLALTLPGIVGGLAFGLGATIAVLKDFNAVLPEVGREFSRIQDLMSGDFWSLAERPIKNLTTTLLPQLEGGLRVTSVALGNFFGGLADSIRGSLDGELDGMFANLAASIDIAAESNGRLANTIKILGTNGSKYLPRLAGFYNKINQEFSTWLTKAESTGRLNEIIETAIVNAKDLGSVLSNAGGILAGIARAAERAGGSSLSMLAEALERIHKAVDSPGFQDGLVDVLEGAHDAMNRISNQSGPAVSAFFKNFASTLSDAFRSAGDAIGSLLDGVFRGLNTDGFATGFLDFLNGIGDGIRALEPMWEPLGNAIGAIGTLAGELARNFGPLLSQLLVSLSGMVLDVVPKLTPVIEALTSTLGGALTLVLPIVSGLVDAFTGLVGPLLSSEAGVIAVTTALVGFRIAVAAKGMEAGLATLLSFFGASGKAGAMASAIGTVGTKLGIVGASVAAIVGVVSWASQLGVQAPKVADFALALERMGNSRTIDNVAKLENLFQGGDNWLQESGESAADVTSLADAIGFLSEWDNAGWWDKFLGGGKSGDGFGMHSAGMKQSKESVEALDQALANVATSGNAEALASAQSWLAKAAEDSGMSVETLANKYLPQYSSALEANSIAQQQAARDAQWAALQQDAALQMYEDALSRVGGLSPGAVQSINDVSKEFIDLAGALEGEALPSVDAWISKLEEQRVAMDNWATNLATLAQRGVTEGVLVELAKLGPEGAPMIAQLTTASDAELARLEEVMRVKSGGAVDSATNEFSKLDEKARAELDKLPPEAKAVLEEMGILMNTGGAEAGNKLASGLSSKAAQVYSASGGLGRNAVTGANTAQPGMSSAGQSGGSAFSSGLMNKSGSASGAGTVLANSAQGGAGSVSLFGTGAYVGQGFADGIMSKAAAAAEAAALMATRAAQAAAGAMKIASPSRVMIALGEWVSLGFAKGIEDKAYTVDKAMKKVTDAVTGVDFADPLAGRGDFTVRTGSASATAALAEGDATTGPVDVHIDGPVWGMSPYELASSVQQKLTDALNAEGLAS